MSFPTTLTGASDGITEIVAAHLNALEEKIGIDGSLVVSSLDYLLKNPASINPGHKHSKLYASDGSPEVVSVDAAGIVSFWGVRLNFADVDIDHGITAALPTDVGGSVATNNSGGLLITGISDDGDSAIKITSILGLADPNDLTPAILFTAGKKNSTGYQALGALETVFQLKNYTTTLITILGDGKITCAAGIKAAEIVVGTATLASGYPFWINGAGDQMICIEGGNTAGMRFKVGTPYMNFIMDPAGTFIISSATCAWYFSQAGLAIFTGNMILGTAWAVGTSALNVLGIASGTAPTTAPADMAQLWVEDINGAAGYAGLHKRTETTNQKEVVPGVIIKTDTGSPANPYEGLMEINTADNKVRMYADAGWRELGTW